MVTADGMSTKAIAVQLLAVLCASISGISNGMQAGWTAPVLPLLEKPDSTIDITETDVVWLESILWIGSIVGLPLTVVMLNKFGSKISTLIAAVENLVAWILIACATSKEFLYVGRLLGGIGSNNAFVSTPIYIAEITDKRIRGFFGTFTYTTMLMGLIVVYSVAPFVSLPISSAVGALFLVIQLLTFPFMPDTPYYLLLKGKKDKARKSLQFVRASEDVGKELDEIGVAIERQKNEPGRCIDLCTVKSNRKGVIIMTILNFTQHFSGISVTFMNIHSILEDAVFLSPNLSAILFAVLMLLSALCASVVVDKIGRKLILGSSCFLTAVCLFLMAVYFTLEHLEIKVQSYNWVLSSTMMLYAICFKFGIGLIPIVMTAEIFPSNVKAFGVTIADVMYVTFGFISIQLYQFLKHHYGIHVPFYIFGCCCLGTGLFSVFYIPETKGKTLEEIQMILKS
ncbi:hypothetical protein RN001_012528 [Aquatica leii]|uniref:Major facilitator superfamily (MFS) profile domain-containing protein n=1 Tax=Aquatica leii TaxID=1421715 RepID=A0AAN7S7T8_9COLE|nr:hypothetical protein RN001_012528 [Aquatica leii]